MFSSGNGTERKRMTVLNDGRSEVHKNEKKGEESEEREIVVDMFAGIGYFTIPYVGAKVKEVRNREKKMKAEVKKAAKRKGGESCTDKEEIDVKLECEGGRNLLPASNSANSVFEKKIPQVVAIEKNPLSFSYLVNNLQINSIENYVTPLLGDNREVGNEWKGRADRVLMGFYPNTEVFLPRGLEFVSKKRGGVIHYHHLCTKSEFRVKAVEQFEEMLVRSLGISRLLLRSERENFFQMEEFGVVKSHSPHIYHCVADIRIFPLVFETVLPP